MSEDLSDWWVQYVRSNQQLILNISDTVMESFCFYLKQLEKNQADWIKTGDVQVSRNELSVKEIILKGLALYNLRKYNEAMEYYDRAIKMDPNNAYAWYNKGNALYASGKYNEAMEYYDRAIKMDPSYAMRICQ
jgi:tetratricopeptide (TPR) repeat protein